MASTCLALNNFNGVMEVLSGLQAPSVSRLAQSWKLLSGDAAKAYRVLSEQMSLEPKNATKLRTRMEQAAAPVTPYVAFYVQDLAQLEDAEPTYYEDGRVNMRKQLAKLPLLRTLRTLQAEARDEPYNLVEVEFVQEFIRTQTNSSRSGLRQSALLDDEQLMVASYKREPAKAEEQQAALERRDAPEEEPRVVVSPRGTPKKRAV